MTSSQVSSVTSPESGGRSEIPNLGGSDSSPILITGHKLNGHNYLLVTILSHRRSDHAETTEPGFRKWKIENSMIMSWLINSMNNDIGENFLLFGTAKDIWDAAKETYSSSENTSELFQVESALHDFRQGEQLVTQYYNTLTRELDDVRGRIMGIKPLPSLREAFREVRREESRKKVMMGSKEQPAPTLDASPLLLGHYKETCWKLHGKPADWKPKPRFDRDGRAHVAANSESTSVPEPSPFNKEQMEMLHKLLSQVGSGSTTGVAFTANRGGMKPWIVDTGASDHMTGDAAILQNYKPSNGHSSVHIADGSKSKIAGTGSIKLTKDLYLDSVLHVPNLDCNLLSISKLARDLQCVTKFYPNSCVFRDLKSGKMIGGLSVFGSTSSHVANSQTKSLKQVAYSLRVFTKSFPIAPTELSTPMPSSSSQPKDTNVPSPVTIRSPMPIQPIAPQLSSEENIGEDRVERKGVRRCLDHPIGNYVTYEGLSPSYRAFATSLDDTRVPNTIQEALKFQNGRRRQDEIDALEKNGTWTITVCGWEEAIDYRDFCSVAKPNTIDSSLIGCQSRLVLATTEHKNAFLNGNLEEEVYMEIPPVSRKYDKESGQADHTLFVKKSHAGKMTILIVYVDDIILYGNDMEELQNLKKYLSEEFEVKDLGNLKYFFVSQRKYILDLLKETGMLGCKPIDTPMDSRKKLGIEKESTFGRGEISAACWALDLSLTHSADIGFARSTSGYCSFVWGNLVTWRSKKQSVVARSSAEAEYRALAQGICEGIWIKRVLSELGQTSSSPILMITPCIMTGPSMLRLTDTSSQRR
ncbi:hypothetical protein AAG906_034949 [Vitis piasezkii]